LKSEGIFSFIQKKMTTNCNPLRKHKSRKSLSQSFPTAVICYVPTLLYIEVPIEEKEFS
jgi:hypothetical protein